MYLLITMIGSGKHTKTKYLKAMKYNQNQAETLKKGKLTQMEILAELAIQIYVTCQDCHRGWKLTGKSWNGVSHSGGRLMSSQKFPSNSGLAPQLCQHRVRL